MPYHAFRDDPLTILVCDADVNGAQTIDRELRQQEGVRSVFVATTLSELQERIEDENLLSVVIIDPLSLGLDSSSECIFRIRQEHPKIIFVLYVDQNAVEDQRLDFYKGKRGRFSHYYFLDKTMSQDELAAELAVLLRDVRNLIAYHALDAKNRGLMRKPEVDPKSVFLSYRFAESEYVAGLTALLEERGFDVRTGSEADTYISKAILERIRRAEYFLCLMTRAHERKDGTFATSSWLLEEKGAALALGKRIVLMVEDGVEDIGGLQGDWQQIRFKPKEFTVKALQAAQQLASYSGERA